MLWFAHSFYAVLIPVQALISWARDGSLGPHLHFLRTTIQSLNTPAWLTQSTTAVATLSAAPRSRQPSFGSISAPPISRGRDHDQPCWMVSFAVRTLLLAFLSALPSYLWYMAAGLTTMGNLTAIYNTSAFWAYAFSIWFCVAGERFAWTKISAVFVSLIGVACISLLDPPESDAQPQASAMDLGNLVALAGAVAYGLYEALYKKYAVPAQPSVAFANFFTGCIGVFTVLVLWIPIPILHVLGVEPFEVPTATQLGFLCIVALMGLAFNACFMLLIAFTSPVMAAVGIMLTIPCIAVTDLAIGTVAFIPWNSVLGSSLICLGFLVLASRD
ncbi:hypothetical protein GGF31_005820 [Allomyces arbusculus]|nr:hypothetical protein GGF31_005820 [Allomyces arbusculus]